MTRMTPLALVLVSAFLSGGVPVLREGGGAAEDEEKNPRSPFEAVRWDGKSPHVRVGGEWFRLVAIDGLEAREIVAFCETTYGGRAVKRFEEDLEEVLSRMGRTPGETASLSLETGSGARVERPAVPFTEANRRAIREAGRTRGESTRGRDSYAKLSPFSAVRWRAAGGVPEVEVGGEFRDLVSIDGIEAAAIVAFCETTFGRLARKRFEEDLVEVLARMGHPTGRTVALVLASPGGGAPITVPAAEMTEANRAAIWAAAQAKPAGRERGREREKAETEEREFAKLAPFTAVRWNESAPDVPGVPDVEVGGEFRRLLAIDGVPAADVVRFCETTYGARRVRKRFSEDLVEVMTRLGRPPGATVDLTLAPQGGSGSPEVVAAPMTAENRARVLRSNAAGDAPRAGSGGGVPRVERRHARIPATDAKWRELAAPVAAGDGSRRLSKADAEADLDQLEWLLVNAYSYVSLSGVDVAAAFDAVRSTLDDAGPTRETFSIQVRKLLALLGDGHTRLDEDPSDSLPQGYLPFLVAEADGRLVAFKADRSGFVDADRPYLTSLDGVAAEEWLETAGRFVPRLSPVFHRRQSERFLREIQFLRRVRGETEGKKIDVVLSDESGRKTKRHSLDVASRKPTYGEWPRATTRLLDGNVGYLRIAEMDADPAFVESIEKSMAGFSGTRALVIDVRGNGGGRRDLLRVLFPYFMKAGDAPRVANVARYRIPPGEPADRAEGYLADRFLFPLGSREWGAAERSAIESFATGFRPEWTPESGFSDWHYLVLSPRPGVRAYEKPVAVLLDGDCFSATDVFLGAFKGWRNVTLVGTRSGGGSGRARGAVLERSGLRVAISSMASFRPDGRLYDRNGVEPDVVVEATATDLWGKTDSVLDVALRRVLK